MIKFLKNLFNIGKQKPNSKKVITYKEQDVEIIIDMNKKEMVIKTPRYLSQEDIVRIFNKYMLGDE